MEKIKLFNFYTKEYEVEKTFGGNFLNFVYLTKLGQFLRPFFNSKFFSRLYSLKKKSIFSISEINNFISIYEINNDEFRPYALKDTYKSFNDYFIRVFKEGVRNFDSDKNCFSAFCEARYMICDLSLKKHFNVKNQSISLISLLHSEELAERFKDSYLVVARLAPVDYHHFHYPIDGTIVSSYRIEGRLDSVTPIATKMEGEVFLNNERVVNLLKTNDFGEILYIEVGALAVGKILNTHQGKNFKKGEAKGYFEFGGSTVLCLIRRDKIVFLDEILSQSNIGIETYIHLGETIGHRRLE